MPVHAVESTPEPARDIPTAADAALGATAEELDESFTEAPVETEPSPDAAVPVDAAATVPVIVEPTPGAFVDATTAVHVEGTLTVASGLVEVADEARTESADAVILRTNSGLFIEVTGALVEDAVSGTAFSGTVAVPAESAAAVNLAVAASFGTARVLGASPLSATDLADAVIGASAETNTVLTVVAATMALPEVAAAKAPKAHTADVAIITKAATTPTSSKPLTDSGVTTMISKLSTYWQTQSGGQITSLTQPGAVKRFTMTDPCAYVKTWEESFKRFGDASGKKYFNGSGRHLIVLVATESGTSCSDGTGWGTVGGQVHEGGVTWVPFGTKFGQHAQTHEIGHNLGLNHSQSHTCTGAVVEGKEGKYNSFTPDTCIDRVYADAYDVMGGSTSVQGSGSTVYLNAQVPALNVAQKSLLGAISSADVPTVKRTVTLGTTTKSYTLNPISANSGVRGLKVIDPDTNESYYIEYRSGTGIDTGALYTQDLTWNWAPGVRVLRIRADETTAVLTKPEPVDDDRRALALATGQSLTGRSGKLTVKTTAMNSTSATVSISLGSGAPAPSVSRISGDDRYTTSVAISKAGFPTSANVVYVATGTNYPDALGAAPAATKEGGPLLLTPPNALPRAVELEINRLKPTKIVVVGGTSAVSNTVFNKLKTLAKTTVRLAGSDRFDTSRKVIAHAFTTTTPSAYVATGLNYPDALSASAAAGAKGLPVFLVNGGAASVDAATTKMLKDKKVTQLSVVGGTGAVSAGIATGLGKISSVVRISGKDRFETSQKINKAAFGSAPRVYFATGFQFPDALAGAVLAGSKRAPLYVVQPGCVPAAIRSDLSTYKTTSVTLIGGKSALNAGVETITACK
ncbi:hypothetical protein GCM10027056_24890 [Glaciibacter psychrotolerans]